MGEKDITEKILEDHNDVFADIINGLIFAGEQIMSFVRPEMESAPEFRSYDDALSELTAISKEKRIIFVIDEYPYLAKAEAC